MPEIQCEDCGAFISAPSRPVAGKLRCPHCRTVNLVPADAMPPPPRPETLPQAVLLEDDEDQAASASARSASGAVVLEAIDDEPAPTVTACPACQTPMPAAAVQCMACGYNTSAGTVMEVSVEQRDPLRDLMGLTPLAAGIGLVVVVACAGIWSALVILTGHPLGFAALGFAAVLGLAIPNLAERRDWRVGLSTAGMVLLSLVLGKLMILGLATSALAAADVTQQPRLMRAAVGRQMIEARSFPPELQEAIDQLGSTDDATTLAALRDESPGSLSVRIEKAVDARIATMDAPARRAAAADLLAAHPDLIRLQRGERAAVSLWDAVWFAGALYIAYRLSSGPPPLRRRGLVTADDKS